MRSEARVSRCHARACGQFVVVAMAAALQAGAALAGPPPAAPATLRERVGGALRDEARAVTLDERSVAVRRLIDLHHELGAHPRFTASGTLQGMQRHVAIRLGATRQALLRDYGGRRDAAGGGANQALALVDIIQQTVHPDFWDVHGGPGKVAYFAQGRSLVVLGSEQVHDDVGNLLDQLRHAGP
ncbi:MAG: hypothetical protein EBR23_03210 [Planctomycetia bacterium]|nr:hypothetical protein [Planctomycetia bacterium]